MIPTISSSAVSSGFFPRIYHLHLFILFPPFFSHSPVWFSFSPGLYAIFNFVWLFFFFYRWLLFFFQCLLSFSAAAWSFESMNVAPKICTPYISLSSKILSCLRSPLNSVGIIWTSLSFNVQYYIRGILIDIYIGKIIHF